MRKYEHINLLVKSKGGVENKAQLADLLVEDLKQSSCLIYGKAEDEQLVLLAELKVQLDSIKLHNGFFKQHIEFVVAGKIINDQYPALTYCVDGAVSRFYGRCSMIPQVCGVDLYLDKSYTGKQGDWVQQKLTVPVGTLYRSLK